MAMHTITAKNIGALTWHDYPGTWRLSEALRALITRLEARLAYWLRYRQTVAELRYLSEHQLADIGVTRGSIEAAARTAARRGGRDLADWRRSTDVAGPLRLQRRRPARARPTTMLPGSGLGLRRSIHPAQGGR